MIDHFVEVIVIVISVCFNVSLSLAAITVCKAHLLWQRKTRNILSILNN